MPLPPVDPRRRPAAPPPDREVELHVVAHADGRQIVVRRETDEARRVVHIEAVVR